MKRDLLSSSADSEIIIALMSIRELEEAPMEIIGGLDVHRKQLTFDYLEIESGEVKTGQIRPASRENLRSWLCRFEGKRHSRWKPLRGGASWSRSFKERAVSHTWPNRPTRAP